ncbi:hypothetical protein NPA11_03460 [Mycoplasma sp. 1578d]|nr:hypothetical protein [Mycoplasma sp. 1578d]UUM19794.1 hypothetical protein NPA11_03460 [Mycoplasma sp. 1578d]
MKQILSSENENWVVIDEFKSEKTQEKEYQSEEQLENKFISDLMSIGYEYVDIKNEKELKANLRKQI